MTHTEDIPDPGVRTAFENYPEEIRDRLLALRRLILETAAQTQGVGDLEETLKWGQPSYLTSATKAGSTIRIDRTRSEAGHYAMYFHCQTNLISTFREVYPDTFTYEGNRSILFEPEGDIPEAELRHCISMALTYHLRKKQNRHT